MTMKRSVLYFMRTAEFAGIAIPIIITIALSGCSKAVEDLYRTHTYSLSMSIRDAAGNDLVAPLDQERWLPEETGYKRWSKWSSYVNPDIYRLDILLPNPSDTFDNTIYNSKAREGFIPDIHRPWFTINKYDDNYNCSLHLDDTGEQVIEEAGYWYLVSEFAISEINNVFQHYLTYKITFPLVFGNDSVHEIIAYWKEEPLVSADSQSAISKLRFPECTRVVFDGADVDVKKAVVTQTEFRDYYSYFIDIVLDK